MSILISMGQKAKEASYELGVASPGQKNEALTFMAEELIKAKEEIIKANEIDRQNAIKKGITDALLDRLSLDDSRIEAMAQGLLDIVKLQDPVGEVTNMWQMPNGLQIGQKRVPIGVLGIIYESRPNVTSDAAGLCLKSGNAVILRGASDAINSNKAVAKALVAGIKRSGLPQDCVQLLEDTSRETAREMMRLNDYIDVLIPRGGAGLIKSVVQNATVPVIETGAGICHLYVDQDASLDMALEIAKNAKIQRPSVCNAIETILVHQKVAQEFLPKLQEIFKNVQIYGDEKTRKIIDCLKATEKNYATEYDDYICNIKVVDDIEEAIEHIYTYSTKHSESIITENKETAKYFMDSLDSACVYHNASTRFSDGGEFGFGAEVGISTQKLHARGPLGLQEITSTKYMIYGNGQVRS